MKTIRFNISAAWTLAALATLVVVGNVRAEVAGKVRLTDSATGAQSADADGELVIRGSSAMRQRNAQTTQALRKLFRDGDVEPAGLFRQSSAVTCDSCIPCVPPACAAPQACCPPSCIAPSECCPPQGCECPVAGGCCPPGDGCCPNGESCCPGTCDGCTAAGQARISDRCRDCGGRGCSSCRAGDHADGRDGRRRARHGSCQHGHPGSDCPICNSSSCLNHNCVAGFLSTQAVAHRARNRLASANVNQYFHCKFGYFIHDGNGGIGSPMFGHYEIVYPADAGYADGRDGQVYAAQGYGGAVSVPLAPTVRSTYNYGWGIPSSRLTPVSNIPTP